MKEQFERLQCALSKYLHVEEKNENVFRDVHRRQWKRHVACASAKLHYFHWLPRICMSTGSRTGSSVSAIATAQSELVVHQRTRGRQKIGHLTSQAKKEKEAHIHKDARTHSL